MNPNMSIGSAMVAIVSLIIGALLFSGMIAFIMLLVGAAAVVGVFAFFVSIIMDKYRARQRRKFLKKNKR